jgi:hypothetical protein
MDQSLQSRFGGMSAKKVLCAYRYFGLYNRSGVRGFNVLACGVSSSTATRSARRHDPLHNFPGLAGADGRVLRSFVVLGPGSTASRSGEDQDRDWYKTSVLRVYPIAAGPARAGNGISERHYGEKVEAVG